jgi:hypothetical protein
MGLNPAFEQQPGRTLPISFGYVKATGDIVLFTVTIAGVAYNLAILGEGEMDGKEIPVMYLPPIGGSRSGLGSGNGTTALVRNLLTTLPILGALTSGSRFHPGQYGVKGAGLGFVSVGGGDQFPDTWFANFPNVTPPQTLSGMAYDLTLGPGPLTVTSGSGDDTMTFSPTPAPIGIYRGVRCRMFDVYGNVTGYGFTTNPAWHMVELILRYKIKPQQPSLAGLTTAEKACFNWPSIVAYAARCAYVLTNGAPRFAYSGAFASDSTLTDMLETLLRCSRGYIIQTGGQIFLMGDDERDSTFLFDATNMVDGSLSLDKKFVATAANMYVPKFRDLNIPAVAAVVNVVDYAAMGLNSSSPFLPRGWESVKFISDGINPFTIGTVMVLGGSTDGDGNPSWDGNYVCAYPYGDGAITDIGVSEDGVTILAAAAGGATGGATGGYLGVENGRFAQRAPTNVRHRAHQKATGGPDAPGLSSRLNVVPVEYDMGNMTFDQAIRLMTYEMIRDLGPDVDGWKAPFVGKITGWLEAVDVNGKALIDQVPGSIITLNDWVTPEFAGDYEVQERVIKGPSATQPGTIQLTLQSKTDASAYTDIVVEPDATFFTVPNSGLSMADRMPAMSGSGTRPYMAMQCTPSWDGLDTITADDCQIWWAGNPAPTGYAYEVSGLTAFTNYILCMSDPDGAGTAVVFNAVPGMDFSSLPAGFIPLGVFTTGSGDITESVSGYSYDGHWIP